VTLVSTKGLTTRGPAPIVTDGTNVYWTFSGSGILTASGLATSAGSVMQVSVDGGGAITLAAEPQAASCNLMHIAVHGGSLFWTTPYYPDGGAGTGTVEMVPIGGGSPTLLASVGPGWPLTGIAVDSSRLYWSTPDSIMALPLDGGAPVSLVSPGADSIAVDSANLYWAGSGVTAFGPVAQLPLDGGVETTIAATQDSPSPIAVDDTSVYWAAQSASSPVVWNLNAAPIGGGPVTVLRSADSAWFVVDAGNLYSWSRGDLVRMPVAGGSVTTLAVVGSGMPCGQSTAWAGPPLAVDSTSVYWVNPDGSVMKVAK
jgi:hypothetical protein